MGFQYLDICYPVIHFPKASAVENMTLDEERDNKKRIHLVRANQ